MSDKFLTSGEEQLLKLKALLDGNRRTKGGKAKKMPLGEPYIFRKVYYKGQLLLEPLASSDMEKIDIEEGDEFVTGYLHEVLTVVPK